MSLSLIKGALENKIMSITPNIATAYENVAFTPTAGVPYQELFFVPAINEAQYINEVTYKAKGIFQINLNYLVGVGTADVMARAKLYVDAFYVGLKMINQGQEVIISDTPDVRVLGKNGDRYIVVISVNWKAFL